MFFSFILSYFQWFASCGAKIQTNLTTSPPVLMILCQKLSLSRI